MKKVLLTLFVALATVANAFNIGDTTPSFSIKDQFEKAHTISADTKTIIFAAGKGTGDTIKEYLLSKKGDFLTNNNAVYVADITGMPSLITKFFALPKMKKYPFSILLVNEEQAKKFSVKKDKITIYKLENGKVANISYISTKEELAKAF